MAFWSGRPPQISLCDVTIPPPHTFRGDFAMVDIYEGRSQVGCDAEHEVHLHELFMKMIETCKLITEVNRWIRLEPSDSSLLATALKLDADVSRICHPARTMLTSQVVGGISFFATCVATLRHGQCRRYDFDTITIVTLSRPDSPSHSQCPVGYICAP